VIDDPQTPIETLFLYYANPLASSPRPAIWRQALERIPFVVSFSPFLDETTRYADVVLPDLLPYERWQDAPAPVSYPHPVWGVARPMVAPPDGGANTGDVVLAVAKRLGGSVEHSLPYDDFEGLLKARAQGLFSARRGMVWGDEFERRHHREMQQRGWWLPESSDFGGFWNALIERGGWTDLYYDDTDPSRLARTPSGRIDMMPAALRSVLEGRQNQQALYVDIGPERVDVQEDYPLRLLPYRVSTLSSGTMTLARWLAEQPGIFPDVHWVPWVEVAPETARELGFEDGTNVYVVSRSARYLARLKVFPGTAPQNVCVPYGLRYPDGDRANPLELLNETGDPLTGLPAWSSTFVRLERA
jgi:anaerobic selenocysteine-containing dehydrogenase